MRDSKLGNNVCVLEPHHVFHQLHKKSYFKAATGFLMGQERSLEYEKSEKFAEIFQKIAKNVQMKSQSKILN